MKNIKKEQINFRLFNKTSSGASKLALFIMGVVLGLVSSTLFGYMCGNYNATGNYQYYDWFLFIAIFLLILTGELIGIYFGAYEEFNLYCKNTNNDIKNEKINEDNKEEQKVLLEDNNNVVVEEKKVKRVVVKNTNKTVKKNNISSKSQKTDKSNVEKKEKKSNESKKNIKKPTSKRKTINKS